MPKRKLPKCIFCKGELHIETNHIPALAERRASCVFPGGFEEPHPEYDIEVIACSCGATFCKDDLTLNGQQRIHQIMVKYNERLKPIVSKADRVHVYLVKTPGPKKCKRCGRGFSDPVPLPRNENAVTSGLLFHDIACGEWCANCNRVAMAAVYRNNSIYFDQSLPFGGLSEATFRSTEEG